MYADNELLFPPHAITHLRTARGAEWTALIERVLQLPEDHPEHLAFSLMMVRLNGCLGCETDSYRAMRGCVACTRQTLRRYKGTDEDLMREYRHALIDIENYLDIQMLPPLEVEALSARAA